MKPADDAKIADRVLVALHEGTSLDLDSDEVERATEHLRRRGFIDAQRLTRQGEAHVTALLSREADALLRELLVAFGLHRAPGQASHDVKVSTIKRASEGMPTDPAERVALWQAELVAAVPTLRRVVSELRSLQGPVLPSEADYRAARQGIIETWNAAIYDNEWLDLPPLCRVCGVPVLRRAGERLSSGDVELSTVCSDKCRGTARQREHRK